MNSTPNGPNPKWTQPRMNPIPDRFNPECTQPRRDSTLNGLNPKWTQLFIAYNIFTRGLATTLATKCTEERVVNRREDDESSVWLRVWSPRGHHTREETRGLHIFQVISYYPQHLSGSFLSLLTSFR